MQKRAFSLITLLLTSTLFFTGCVTINLGGLDGGVYRSENKGINWEQKVFVLQQKNRTYTIGHTNVITMVFDPTDSQTVYIGTESSGAYVSHNRGEKYDPIPQVRGEISNIAINPQNNKILYFSTNNQVIKSIDKGASWKLIFTESNGHAITSLGIDPKRPQNVYIGTAHGEFIRSTNSGESWTIEHGFEDAVVRILSNTRNSNIIYVATKTRGIHKSTNAGQQWVSLQDNFKDFQSSYVFHDMIIDETVTDGLYHASQFGILHSIDGGRTWQKISLISVSPFFIHSLAQNPKNAKELYYATGTNFFATSDGGNSWITIPLPSKKTPSKILIDPKNPDVLYMGVKKIKQ